MTSPEAQGHLTRIQEIDDAWRLAAARRDLDGMVAIYAPDAREMVPGMAPLVGRDAIRAHYRALIDTFPRFAHDFTAEEILVSASGDLAVGRGTYRFTPDTDRPGDVQSGRFVGVWRHIDGDWRLSINISITDDVPTP